MTELEPTLTPDKFDSYVTRTATQVITGNTSYESVQEFHAATQPQRERVFAQLSAGDIDIHCEYPVSAEVFLPDEYVTDWDAFTDMDNMPRVEQLVGDVLPTVRMKATQKFRTAVEQELTPNE